MSTPDAQPRDREERSGCSDPLAVRLRLQLAFDGAAYAGWQAQKIGLGVQEVVEKALWMVFPGAGRIHGSSRTDTGVHARGLVAHVDIPRVELRMAPRKVLLALNAHLPEDIRVLRVSRAPRSFHARFDARGKEYRYDIWNHPAHDPITRRTAWHVPRALDLQRMRSAAARFVGRHDFRAFAAERGYPFGNTVRTLSRCSVLARGPLITVVIVGDGFLYRMCRGIVGTLVAIGLGKMAEQDLDTVFESRDRRVAGMNAPAHGLVLCRVLYRRGAGEPPVAPDPGPEGTE